jgi:hypothetical protein
MSPGDIFAGIFLDVLGLSAKIRTIRTIRVIRVLLRLTLGFDFGQRPAEPRSTSALIGFRPLP